MLLKERVGKESRQLGESCCVVVLFECLHDFSVGGNDDDYFDYYHYYRVDELDHIFDAEE